MRRKSGKIIIDLGKGVKLSVPFKGRWSLAEWRRMNAYVDDCIGKVKPADELEAYR